jgi:hypothetical protein
MIAFGQRIDPVEGQSGRATQDDDIPTFQSKSARTVIAFQAAEEELVRARGQAT